MNWKGNIRKRSLLILKDYPGIFLKGLRKATKNSVMITGLWAEI
jgi:hypothetical protein